MRCSDGGYDTAVYKADKEEKPLFPVVEIVRPVLSCLRFMLYIH